MRDRTALFAVLSLAALGTLLYLQRKPVPIRGPGPVRGRGAGSWRLPAVGYKYKPWFDRATLVYQLPKNMLARMAQQESSFRPNVISRAGAVGLMQIMPKFHPGVDPTVPKDSIFYAAEYLRNLYNRFGDWRLAMAAYNWGPTNLAKFGFDRAPLETKRYVAKVSYDVNVA